MTKSGLNGYLQNDIHFMKKNIYFSETQDGKDVKYKIVDIKSLVADNAMQDGKQRTFILIDDDPKFPFLATEVFKGKHVVGYMEPYAFENTITSRTFTVSRMLPVPIIQVVDHITIWLMAASMCTIGICLKVKKLMLREKNTLKRNC